MDSSGKIIWARHNEVQTVNVKSLGADYELADGERLPLATKDLGACDLYPQVGWSWVQRGGGRRGETGKRWGLRERGLTTGWQMGSDCPWLLRTWGHVTCTHR
jgi:hypothetical protein